jgi:hypothetical protein
MLPPALYIASPSARAGSLALMMVASFALILTCRMRRKRRCVLVTGVSLLKPPHWILTYTPLAHPPLQHAAAGGQNHPQRVVNQAGRHGSKERLT